MYCDFGEHGWLEFDIEKIEDDNMSICITNQIIRDYLVFSGPSTVSELCGAIKAKSGMVVDRAVVLDALKALEEGGSASFDADKGIYTARIEL